MLANAENPPTRADYATMVEAADSGVGKILQTVERLGLTNNTIVIFTNDNGGEWLSNGGPLFNRKWTVWEGGIRVPAIVKWPGKIRAGTVSDQPAITFDWSASIIAAAGATVPPQYEGIERAARSSRDGRRRSSARCSGGRRPTRIARSRRCDRVTGSWSWMRTTCCSSTCAPTSASAGT